MASTAKRTSKLQEFTAHSANVNCLAMGHKSNQVLVTGGDDKKVNLWAIGREGCLLSLSGHSTPVECVSFDHSEDMVCAGSQMGALKIWDLEAAKLIRTMTGHKEAIKCMDFHPYGGYLTTGSCDMDIRLWDTRQRGCICKYSSHRMAVNSLQFSPDGQWIASGGEEGAVKVWDVRTGRVFKEFNDHRDSVTCVKFHPHEFLLASCGSDRIINFRDMEKFQLVSATEKLTSIRQLWFSEDGTCLLGGGNEGLQVIGWEPARQFDVIPAAWGQIHDMTVAHNKLIAGWFHSSNVVLNVVNLNMVHPFGGPQPTLGPIIESASPFQKNTSVRKSFSKERPAKQVVHRKSLLDEKTVEESGTEEEEVPAVIPNISGYTEIFRPSRTLNRTPPPSTSLISPPESLGSGVNQPLSLSSEMRGLSMSATDPPSPTYHSAPTSLNSDVQTQLSHRSYESVNTPMGDSDNEMPVPEEFQNINVNRSLRRQHSDGEKVTQKNVLNVNQGNNHLKPSSSDLSLGVKQPPRSYSFSRPIRTADVQSSNYRDYSSSSNKNTNARNPSVDIYVSKPPPPSQSSISHGSSRNRSPSPDFIPIATDRPVGIDLEEFLPKTRSGYSTARNEMSEQEALSSIMSGHESMMAVLAARQRALQVFHSMWMNKNLKVALESTSAAGDLSVVVDILNVIVLRPSIWTLDICVIVLPQINKLLQSKYESYMTTGCTVLRLILRNFASVIASNVRSGGVGVDIPREERIARCRRCRELLLDIRSTLQTRRPQHPRLTASFADLQSLIDQSFQ